MKVVTYAESVNTDAIKVLLLLASDIASEKGNNLLSKKVKKICFEIENECLVPQKLSGVQAAACRKFVDLSVGQYQRLCTFLRMLSESVGSNFNIFPSYAKSVHVADVSNLPGTVYYEMISDTNTKEISEPRTPQPINLMEQFTEDLNAETPNIVGCMYSLPDILARELESMSDSIRASMIEKNVALSTVLDYVM